MLAGLGHGAVGGGDDQDGAIHLSSAGNHVLDVVGVARAVNVSVVTLPGLVLDVSDGDGDAALTLLGSLVDVLEGGVASLAALGLGENLGDGRGQRGLAVVDVTNGTDVYVRLGTIELLLGHCQSSFWNEPLRPFHGTEIRLFMLSGAEAPQKSLVPVTGFEPVTSRV